MNKVEKSWVVVRSCRATWTAARESMTAAKAVYGADHALTVAAQYTVDQAYKAYAESEHAAMAAWAETVVLN